MTQQEFEARHKMKLAELIEPFNPQKEVVVYREHICPSGYITYIPKRKERTNDLP